MGYISPRLLSTLELMFNCVYYGFGDADTFDVDLISQGQITKWATSRSFIDFRAYVSIITIIRIYIWYLVMSSDLTLITFLKVK